MKVCSIFSGIGGFELGLSQAGFETVMMCERDELAREVLTHRFPDVSIRYDVRDIKRLPSCDILVAGWPCQDLSQAGRTAGITGTQSGLISEVFRLIDSKRTKPEFVLLENVAFSLQLQRGAAIKYVTSKLEELGYKWAYRILDSRLFGLTQRRRRIFVLGSRSYDPANILFQGAEVDCDRISEGGSVRFGFYWTEGNTGLGWSPEAVPPLKGGSAISIPSPPAIWDKRKKDFFRPGIIDAERMQGFPPGWTEVGKLGDKYRRARWKLVGNAVSVPVVSWIAGMIRAQVGGGLKEVDLSCLRPAHKTTLHNAGFSIDGGEPRLLRLNEGPNEPVEVKLREFLFSDSEPLSMRAARGFLSRIEKSSLKTHPQFIPDLRNYVS